MHFGQKVSARLPIPGKVIYMWPVWFFTTFAQTTGNRSIERTVEILSGKGKFTDPDFVEATRPGLPILP